MDKPKIKITVCGKEVVGTGSWSMDSGDLDGMDKSEVTIEELETMIYDWSGVSDKKGEIKCTTDNKKLLLSNPLFADYAATRAGYTLKAK